MSEMIMRVARAISEADGMCDGDYRKLARAAIEAMREPIGAMIDAVDLSSGESSEDAIAGAWKAMIDEALKD